MGQLNVCDAANKAFQRDVIAVSHLLQSTQKLSHGDSAPEQRCYAESLKPVDAPENVNSPNFKAQD